VATGKDELSDIGRICWLLTFVKFKLSALTVQSLTSVEMTHHGRTVVGA
jgi:hypothetical protein